MTSNQQRRALARRLGVGAAIGLASALVVSAVARLPFASGFISGIENNSYDLRVRRTAVPTRPTSPVVIVDINDSSIRALEPMLGRLPWPRVVHASAIDYISQSGAKVIAFDMLFGERDATKRAVINGQEYSGEQSDRAFVTSVEKAGNVILLADAVSAGLLEPSADQNRPPVLPGVVYRPGSGFQPRPVLQLDFPELSAVAAGVGHNMAVRDDDGSESVRRMLPFIDVHGVAVPAFGVAAALAFRGERPDTVVLDGGALRVGDEQMPLLDQPAPLDGGGTEPSRQALLRFSRPAGPEGGKNMFPVYPYFNVLLSADQLASGRTPEIPASAFAGKLVFIGTRAAGTHEEVATPFGNGTSGATGIELHATLADNILSNSFMRRATPPVDAAATAGVGLVSGIAAAILPVPGAVIAVGALVAAWLVGVTHEVGRGLWMAAVLPSSAAGLALFGGVAWQYFVEGREKRHVRLMFSRYVSRDVVDQLMDDPALAGLGGQRREMTVLFSDIRNFTTATEAGTPETVVAQLNEYFGAMVDVLFRHQGTLDKFVGDMVMGLFGAPIADPRHADHAVETALDMMAALDGLNAKWRAEGKPAVDIGIGINTGEMIAGNIGSEAIMSYTVIGDAVNLGSRLESLNKEHGTHILISDATRAQLTVPVETRFIGDIKVKGKTKAVGVYEVLRPGPTLN